MRRKVGLLFTSMLAIGALTACSGGEGASATDGKVELTIQYYKDSMSDNAIEATINEFEEYNLIFREVPTDDYDTRLRTQLNSSSAPDIVEINGNIPDYFPHSDRFVNLLDYGVSELENEYVEWKWNASKTADGEMIAMPIDVGPTGLIYRKDLFEEAGLPSEPEDVSALLTTREAYLDAARQMKEKTGVTMVSSAVSLFSEFYRQGDGMYNADGELIADDGHIREIWDLVLTALDEGLIAGLLPGTTEEAMGQVNGTYAAFFGASWQRENVANNAPDTAGLWRIAGTPGGASNYGGSFIGVLASTDYPEEAVEVITFLTNADNQLANYVDKNLFPSTPAVYEEPAFLVEEEFFGGQVTNDVFAESAKALKPVYRDPKDDQTLAVFSDQVQLVEAQGKDPEKAWEDALINAKEIAER